MAWRDAAAAGRSLSEADTQGRKQAFQYCGKADQHDQKLQKIGKPPFANELFDGPKANCTDNADNQNIDQN
jgi:hypothetical protein